MTTLLKFDTSHKTNEGDKENPFWMHHTNYHHMILDSDGVIVGYIFDDEDVFELFVGEHPNITVAEIEADIDTLICAGIGEKWDGTEWVQTHPPIFHSKDEKFLGGFNTLQEAITTWENL